MLETRLSLRPEIRAKGRTLSGVVMRYGSEGDRRERFEPGSLRILPDVILNLEHDRQKAIAWPGAGLELRDTPTALELRAELPRIPAADAALQGVKRGFYTGLSVEFRSRQERADGGIRVLEDADLHGVGLVDAPSYPASTVEARQRGTRRLLSSMPTGSPVDCRCSGPDCDSALVEAIELGDDVLGYLGDYSKPVGKASARIVDDSVRTEIELIEGLREVEDMDRLIEAGVPPIVRPYPDPARSVTRKEGRVLVYERLAVAGWIVTFTDQTGGFEAATVAATAEKRRGLVRVERSLDGDSRGFVEKPTRRRMWL